MIPTPSGSLLKMPEPTVILDGICMRFGQQEVLRDINLMLEKGRTHVVIGESGCGKTVLLKLIIGLLRPTEGVVTFDGLSIADLSEKEQVKQRLRIGYVFQNSALFDSMTVFDNVAFALREHRELPEQAIAASVRSRLMEVGMPGGVDKKMPAELSGGMRKRVGLARALMLDPELILYDEPTTGLDPVMTDVINHLIQQTHQRRGVTSIVVTHDLKTVTKVADRVIMLYPVSRLHGDEKQVIFDGTVTQLQISNDPRVQQFIRGEAFLGSSRLDEDSEDIHR